RPLRCSYGPEIRVGDGVGQDRRGELPQVRKNGYSGASHGRFRDGSLSGAHQCGWNMRRPRSFQVAQVISERDRGVTRYPACVERAQKHSGRGFATAASAHRSVRAYENPIDDAAFTRRIFDHARMNGVEFFAAENAAAHAGGTEQCDAFERAGNPSPLRPVFYVAVVAFEVQDAVAIEDHMSDVEAHKAQR